MSGLEGREVRAEERHSHSRVGIVGEDGRIASQRLSSEISNGFPMAIDPPGRTGPDDHALGLSPLTIESGNDERAASSGVQDRGGSMDSKTSNESIDRDGDGSEFDDLARQRLGEPTWLRSPYRNALFEGRRSGADFASQVIQDYMGLKQIDHSLYDISGQGLSYKLDRSPDFKEIPLAEIKKGDLLIAFREPRGSQPVVHTSVSIVESDNSLLVNSNRDQGRIVRYPLDRMLKSQHFHGGFKAYRPPAERAKH